MAASDWSASAKTVAPVITRKATIAASDLGIKTNARHFGGTNGWTQNP